MPKDEIPKVEATEFREMAAVWIRAVHLQIGRYQRSIAHCAAAEFDRDEIIRAVKGARGRIPRWIRYMPSERPRITTASMWQIGIERYFLLLALAQLEKCVKNLSQDNLPCFPWGNEIIELLRNIEEHWDDPVGRSLNTLAGIASSRVAGEHRSVLTASEIGEIDWGGLLWSTGPTVMEVAEWVDDLDRAVRLRAKEEHKQIPDPDELV